MNEFQAEKKFFRTRALARRNELEPTYRDQAAACMAGAAGQLLPSPGAIIAGFSPIRSEPDVRPLLAALQERGARICLPVTLDAARMIFREMKEGVELVASGFGTMAPGPEAAIVDPDLLLVPLAVFDAHGNRIGYGAGFYDRAISRLREKDLRPLLVGVAFDCQEVPAIRAEPHDVPLHAILTESGLRHFAGHS